MGELMLSGLFQSIHVTNLLVMLMGVVIGMIFGAVPGLTGAAAMTILLPLTFVFPAETGVLFLLGIWNAAVYSGSIPAIVLNIPGTAASAATTLDGYELAKQGKATRTLRASVFGSTIGAFVSALTLLFLSPPLAKLSLMFGPAEMFSFTLFGLMIIITLSSGNLVKGLIAGLLGLLMSTIGFAPSGTVRFAVTPDLVDGFPIIVTLIGLFTFPEVFAIIRERKSVVGQGGGMLLQADNFLFKLRDWTRYAGNFARSSIIGAVVGVLPGAGPTIAGFVSYNEAKRASKTPENFGRGEIAGVIASDTANNAAVLSSLVPALTLGIPGSVDAVIILAALTMHGILPGPMLFQENGLLVYTVFMGVFVCNLIMLGVGLLSARHIAQLSRLRSSILAPMIIVFALVGSFAVRNDWFDVFSAFGIGLVGFGLREMDIPLAPMVLGVILGPILERNLYQMVVLFDGHYVDLLKLPIFLAFMALSVLSVVMPLWRGRKEAQSSEGGMSIEAVTHKEERC
jgi:putative tricarboxylic transport membrane protein